MVAAAAPAAGVNEGNVAATIFSAVSCPAGCCACACCCSLASLAAMTFCFSSVARPLPSQTSSKCSK